MKLLVFAYLKEAQSFIELLDLRPISFFNLKIYKNNDYIVLITEEGISRASIALTCVLTEYDKEIKEIINLGIAGSLTPKFSKNEIYQIRTVYGHINQKIEFKSYTTHNNQTTIDLLTSNERVLSSEYKLKLHAYADLVDREAYGIAQAANFFQIPLTIIKIISDDVKDENFCDNVKNEAILFSEKLFDYFQLNFSIPSWQKDQIIDPEYSKILNDSHFHFTHSLYHLTLKLLKDLKLKNINLNELRNSVFYNELIFLEIPKKEKSKRLVDELKKLLDPLNHRIKSLISKELSPFEKHEIQIKADPNLEKTNLEISFKVSSHDELEMKISKLKSLNLDKINNILQGNIE